MSHLKRLCILVSMLVLVLPSVSCRKTAEKVVEPGKAPDFTLTDTQGSARTLSSLRGKVVLVEFWATWCPPCRDSVSELNRLYEKYQGKNFEILGISVDEGSDAPSVVRQFVKEHAVIYPVLVDDRNVNNLYEVSGIPAMFLIDREGKIVKRFTGYIPGIGETLSKEIDALL